MENIEIGAVDDGLGCLATRRTSLNDGGQFVVYHLPRSHVIRCTATARV